MREDADIAFIIGDLPDGTDLGGAARKLGHNRQHIAWARLPAALVPDFLGAGVFFIYATSPFSTARISATRQDRRPLMRTGRSGPFSRQAHARKVCGLRLR